MTTNQPPWYVRLNRFVKLYFHKGNRFLTIFICAILGIIAYTIFTNAQPPELNFYVNKHKPDYHPDEGIWTSGGKFYFEKFFIERDWSYETWDGEKFGSFGDRNPVLGKYIIGASLFLSGTVEEGKDVPGYEFDQLDWDKIKETRPPEEILRAARLPLKWAGILGTILLFLLIRQLSGSWLMGMLAGLVFCLQPHTISFSQKAMNDVFALFFSFLAMFVCSLLLKKFWHKNYRTIVLRSIIIGIVMGLALQIKLSTLLILVTIVIWGLAEILNMAGKLAPKHQLPLIEKLKQVDKSFRLRKKFVLASTIIGITVTAVWILPNPFLYKNPIKNTIHIYNLGSKVKRNRHATEDQKNKTLAKSWRSMVLNGPERSGVFHYWLGVTNWVDKGLVIIGFVMLVVFTVTVVYNRGNRRGLAYMLIWFVIALIGILI